MAVSLPTDQPIDRLTCDATAGNVTQVTLPSGTRAVVLQSVTSAGKLAHTGTDGAAIGSDYITLAADTALRFKLGKARWGSPPVIYLAHADNSGVIEIIAEGD